jgi:hypothetical protein
MTNKKLILLCGVTAGALMLSTAIYGNGSVNFAFSGKAYAADDSSGKKGQGTGKKGSEAGGTGGEMGGTHGSGGTKGSGAPQGSSGHGSTGATGSGQGGPSDDSDAKGPKYGGGENDNKPSPGEQGGKPVWAQEGIPEVELGRMSVVRAPAHVIDKATTEAIANFVPATEAALYSMTAEDFAAYLVANYDTTVRVDSPLENLGLYKDILSDGITQLPGVTPASTIDLAAIFLGSASDKTIAITEETVTAVSIILGLPELTADQITSLAEKAEIVRAAILTGHGE